MCSSLSLFHPYTDQSQMESILAKEIKAFRKQFKKQNGRDPTRKDMAKEADMATKYDTWLSLKSEQKVGGASTSSHTLQKQKNDISLANQSRKRSIVGEMENDEHGVMAPPPVTPKKNKYQSDFNVAGSQLFRTPKRSDTIGDDDEMNEAIDRSGGSVRSLIEVPITPSRKSSSKKSLRTPSTPSSTHFDDGTSPSKLRTLIDSFAATRSRGIVTPTKAKLHDSSKVLNGLDEDEKLTSHLQTKSTRMNSSMFTPRTKARKRLRGEVVITPTKTPQKATIGKQQQITPTKTVRPTKRQRGMGTLKDYGIVPIAGPQSKMKGATMLKMKETIQDLSDEQEDEDDDLIGPSPSTQRIVNVQIQSSFRPLFDETESISADLIGGEKDADMEEVQSSQTDITHSINAIDTALTTPAERDPEAEIDSDEEERMYIREYTRRLQPSDHIRQSFTQSGNKENLDDVIDEEEDGMLVGIGLPTFRNEKADDESEEENLFENLSIHSPQGKKARQQQRRQNARNLRNLLEADKIFDKAAALASNGINDESEDEGEEKVENGIPAMRQQKGGKNDQPSRTSLKTARMMRGRVTKAQKRALAAAEAMEEVEKELTAKGDNEMNNSASRATRKSGKKSMILRRGREDESEEEEEDFALTDEHNIDDLNDHEWASDVDSTEYGLGNGYMDEMDVM